MAHATVTLAGDNYAVDIEARQHRLLGDEPQSGGGKDVGPAPYELLLASLGACTAITLKMYADRKGWRLASVSVDLDHHFHGPRSHIERVLHIEGDLDDAQRARLADIAERTPVTLTLKGGADIDTRLASTALRARQEAELEEGLEESFPASDPLSATRPGEGAD
jgi:putative redox protein